MISTDSDRIKMGHFLVYLKRRTTPVSVLPRGEFPPGYHVIRTPWLNRIANGVLVKRFEQRHVPG